MDERRRTSFNEAPDDYARWRPGYPEALFDAIVAYGGLNPGDAVLEVGCGPGQATLPMARRGLRVVAVEPGERLAAVNRAQSAAFGVTVEEAKYEDWDARGRTFRLVFAGSSFHWVDPGIRFQRAADHLEPGGAVAIFGNKHVATPDDGAYERIQALYREHLPELTRRWEPLPEADTVYSDYREEATTSGRFHDVEVPRIAWSRRFTGEEYTNLLDTYSDHHVLAAEAKVSFYDALRKLIENEFDGSIVRGYATVVCLARRT